MQRTIIRYDNLIASELAYVLQLSYGEGSYTDGRACAGVTAAALLSMGAAADALVLSSTRRCAHSTVPWMRFQLVLCARYDGRNAIPGPGGPSSGPGRAQRAHPAGRACHLTLTGRTQQFSNGMHTIYYAARALKPNVLRTIKATRAHNHITF